MLPVLALFELKAKRISAALRAKKIFIVFMVLFLKVNDLFLLIQMYSDQEGRIKSRNTLPSCILNGKTGCGNM